MQYTIAEDVEIEKQTVVEMGQKIPFGVTLNELWEPDK